MTPDDSETDTSETDIPRRYVWEQRIHPVRAGANGGINGAVLAALRRGIGREPGTVPEMWPYYRELNERGEITPRLRAEHLTLALFGVHQQSKPRSVHQRQVGVGTALAALRDSGRFSEQAVERRFAAFATATSMVEAGTHLRGLITQLRGIDQGLDYTQLMEDLITWQYPASTGAVRRRWGMQFFIASKPDKAGQPTNQAEES